MHVDQRLRHDILELRWNVPREYIGIENRTVDVIVFYMRVSTSTDIYMIMNDSRARDAHEHEKK